MEREEFRPTLYAYARRVRCQNAALHTNGTAKALASATRSEASDGGMFDVFKVAEALQMRFLDPLGTESKPCPQLEQSLGKTLERLVKALNKRKQDAQWTAYLFAAEEEVPVSEDFSNDVVWQEGCRLVFRYGDAREVSYRVSRDRPRFSAMPRLPGLMLVGFPAVCLGLAAENGDHVECLWLRNGKVVSQGDVFTPSEQDVGETLAVACTPCRGTSGRGDVVTIRAERPVFSVSPEALVPLQERLALTAQPAPVGRMRVATYNVLWGRPNDEIQKQREKHSKKKDTNGGAGKIEDKKTCDARVPLSTITDLPVAIEAREYREHIALHEIRGYNADVLCLQEITGTVFTAWARVLADEGFEFARREELVILWRTSRWQHVADVSWLVRDLLDREENSEIRAAFDEAPYLKSYFLERPTVAQAVLLRCSSSQRRVLVVNAHLAMVTFGPHIRSVQMCLILRAARAWAGEDCELVLCGDLNTRGWEPVAESVFSLLTVGNMSKSHYNFVLGQDLGKPPPTPEEQCVLQVGNRPRCTERATQPGGWCLQHTCPLCGDMKIPRLELCTACSFKGRAPPAYEAKGYFACDISQPFGALASAYEVLTGAMYLYLAPFRPTTGEPWPPDGWGEMKDHIFSSRGLKAEWILPPPPLEQLPPMPSLCWASDHLAMLADFSFSEVGGAC